MDFRELLSILACPVCRGSLNFVEEGQGEGFCCPVCKKVYPIRDDIPIMLIEEAIPLEEWIGQKKEKK